MWKKLQQNKIFRFIVSIIVCQLAGILGSIATIPNVKSWYQFLQKPGLTPPNEIFGPVWTTLYFLMGISLYLVWQSPVSKDKKKIPLVIFFVQLVMNTIWSFLFFGMHELFFSFVWIILLWLVIVINIIYFWKVSRIAGGLLIPYILWVSFASYLNFSIWQLN
ncbi:MAG: TspO/MBR family protein [Vulcanimicrobiota bacterium]